MDNNLILYCAIMFVATVAGGAIMLIRRWSDEGLHWFLSFGAGIFIGAVFLHLLPEAMGNDAEVSKIGLYILVGYLLIFFVERILFYSEGEKDHHGHLVTSMTAFIGLSVHSIIEGAALAIGMSDEKFTVILLTSILAHKIPAALALMSLMVLAKQSRTRIVISLMIFAATAPAGALLLGSTFELDNVIGLRPAMGLVTGTFLYVATADILPEVFHSKRRRWLSLVLLIIGIAIIGLVRIEHGHH